VSGSLQDEAQEYWPEEQLWSFLSHRNSTYPIFPIPAYTGAEPSAFRSCLKSVSTCIAGCVFGDIPISPGAAASVYYNYSNNDIVF
jgi:hypothetical protein